MAGLTFGSMPTEIMTSLRRAITVGEIHFDIVQKPLLSVITNVKQMDVAKTHVYDTGRLLDPTDDQCISSELRQMLADQSLAAQIGLGLFLPHEHTAFIIRYPIPEMSTWAHQVTVAQEHPDLIFLHSFLYVGKVLRWSWCGSSEVQRRKQNARILGENDPRKQTTLIVDPLICNALLNLKSDMVIVEPAPWWHTDDVPAKPKAFEIRNPSISIVRVNTARIIVRPPRDDDGSGATVRPHDRRSHLRRRGNKIIQVRATKIHGGAPEPTAKVVKVVE